MKTTINAAIAAVVNVASPDARARFSRMPWKARYQMAGGACCSNPNPQPYDSGDGNPTIRCMNCGC